MNVAFEEADRLLPGRVVAEGDVDLTVYQARHGDRTTGIDHHVGVIDLLGGQAAYGDDLVALGQDGIPRNRRAAPVAGQDSADIDDGGLHVRSPCA